MISQRLRQLYADLRAEPSAVGKRIRSEVRNERVDEMLKLMDEGYPHEALAEYDRIRRGSTLWKMQDLRLSVADMLDPHHR